MTVSFSTSQFIDRFLAIGLLAPLCASSLPIVLQFRQAVLRRGKWFDARATDAMGKERCGYGFLNPLGSRAEGTQLSG